MIEVVDICIIVKVVKDLGRIFWIQATRRDAFVASWMGLCWLCLSGLYLKDPI